MKKSSFERVVGVIPEGEKERLLKSKEEVFDDQIFKELEGKEREKTPDELQLIDLANKITNDLRKKYGLEDFDIPRSNIHVVKKSEWFEKKGTAYYESSLQSVILCEQSTKIEFAEKVFHEMLHFKSYAAMQLTRSDKPEITEYRIGLIVRTRDGKKRYFSSLNEAVTEEIVKRYTIEHIKELSNDPFLAEEIKQTRETINKYPDIKKNSGEPLFDDDIFYANVVEVLEAERSVVVAAKGFSYREERLALNSLINKLFNKNKENFKDQDEVFEIFEKGMITGNILPIGRLIDGTFGKGTFRKIGESDKDLEVWKKIINSL